MAQGRREFIRLKGGFCTARALRALGQAQGLDVSRADGEWLYPATFLFRNAMQRHKYAKEARLFA